MSIPLDIRTLKQGTDALIERSGEHLVAPFGAILGHPETGDVAVTGVDKKGLYWIHSRGSEPGAVTTATSRIPARDLFRNAPVLVQSTTNGNVIIAIDPDSGGEFFDGFDDRNDQSPVKLNQLFYGTLHPDASVLRLLVIGAMYDENWVADQYTGDFATGTVQDTTPANIVIPTANNRAIGVLIQIDPTDGTLEYKQSSEFNAALSLPQAQSAGLLPATDSRRLRIGFLKLIAGMAAPFTYDQIWSVPSFITSPGAGGAMFSQTADKTVANTTTETTLFGTGEGSATLAADALVVGSIVTVALHGHLDTKSSGAGFLTIRATLGGTEIVTTGSFFLSAAMDDNRFEAAIKFVCRSTGGSGTVVASGQFVYDGCANCLDMVKTSTTTIDTAVSLAVDVTAEWDTADVANTITAQIAIIEYQM